jgi:hypothetical protein
MRIPNGDKAIVDVAKLRNYCLSMTHSEGKHKARVFRSALGLTEDHVELLREALLKAASSEDAVIGTFDDHGQRYIIDFKLIQGDRAAIVRSTWIIRRTEALPRLTSSFVL